MVVSAYPAYEMSRMICQVMQYAHGLHARLAVCADLREKPERIGNWIWCWNVYAFLLFVCSLVMYYSLCNLSYSLWIFTNILLLQLHKHSHPYLLISIHLLLFTQICLLHYDAWHLSMFQKYMIFDRIQKFGGKLNSVISIPKRCIGAQLQPYPDSLGLNLYVIYVY